MITLGQLRQSMPGARLQDCERFIEPLRMAMEKHHIDTPMRMAHFLAQTAWESGSLRYTEEIYSGEKYDTGSLAVRLGNTPEKDGDGQRFKGRGLIQLTGKANYAAYGKSVGTDFTTEGRWTLLAEPLYAADSAGWFWEKNHLNELADGDEFTRITQRINGSKATVRKRLPCLRAAKIALGLKKG